VLDLDRYRTGRAYTIADVALLVGSTDATVRRWIKGYSAQGRRMAPVFGEKYTGDTSGVLLSYLDMIEILVAVRFTQHGGKLEKVRNARQFATKKWPKARYPFASLQLKMAGGEMLHDFDEANGGPALSITLGTPENPQYTLPHIVEEALALQDFEQDFSVRWYPAGRDVPIVVDPRYAGGRPSILHRGVTVDTIARRFRLGHEKVASIARDLELAPAAVEEAIRYAPAA
jgi:uncharacterized protein (DUF433 family)